MWYNTTSANFFERKYFNYWMCQVLLALIFLLNAFWYVLVVKITYRIYFPKDNKVYKNPYASKWD